MNKAKRDGESLAIRIYRPGIGSYLRIWILAAMVCIWGYMALAYYDARFETDYRTLWLAVIGFIIVIAYFASRRYYLAIYNNGIVISTPLKKLFSSWDNLKELAVARNLAGKPLYYYLITRDNVDERVKKGQNQISLEKYAKVTVSKITEADYKKLVPPGQLGQDLLYYAPHLFE